MKALEHIAAHVFKIKGDEKGFNLLESDVHSGNIQSQEKGPI